GGVVSDEKFPVVLDGEAGLIAAGHDVAQADAALPHQVLGDGVTESAALRDDGHGAGLRRSDEVRAERGRPQPDVEDAIAVWSTDEQAAFDREALERRLALAPRRTFFSESAGKDDGPAHAALGRRRQQCGNV